MIYLANDTSRYLQHYGVLGMKWGQHRYRLNMEKAKYARNSAKEGDKTAAQKNKLLEYAKQRENKAYKIRAKDERLSSGKSTYNYTAKEGIGKSVVKAMLLGGSYGALKYNKARGKGSGRASSAGHAIVASILNSATLGAAQFIEPRVRNPKHR